METMDEFTLAATVLQQGSPLGMGLRALEAGYWKITSGICEPAAVALTVGSVRRRIVLNYVNFIDCSFIFNNQ